MLLLLLRLHAVTDSPHLAGESHVVYGRQLLLLLSSYYIIIIIGRVYIQFVFVSVLYYTNAENPGNSQNRLLNRPTFNFGFTPRKLP